MQVQRQPPKETLKLKRYPYLGIYKDDRTDIVVLFTAPQTGMVVDCVKSFYNHLGEYSTDWYEGGFVYFQGRIELENNE